MKKSIRGYYFITDSALSVSGDLKDVRSALKAGAGVVQYRAKNVSGKGMLIEARRIRKLCKNSLFIVNDRIDIALACGADGVHVGQDDIPCPVARKLLGKNGVIGVTVHSVKQARQALAQGADYIAVSPVFRTGTKKDAGTPVGVKLVERIRKITDIPVVAIGGIDLTNAAGVIKAGADAVCAISCVVASGNVTAQILKFQKLFERY